MQKDYAKSLLESKKKGIFIIEELLLGYSNEEPAGEVIDMLEDIDSGQVPYTLKLIMSSSAARIDFVKDHVSSTVDGSVRDLKQVFSEVIEFYTAYVTLVEAIEKGEIHHNLILDCAGELFSIIHDYTYTEFDVINVVLASVIATFINLITKYQLVFEDLVYSKRMICESIYNGEDVDQDDLDEFFKMIKRMSIL